jgi:ABC-type multidrug transport system fused ATPase/permease subunit
LIVGLNGWYQTKIALTTFLFVQLPGYAYIVHQLHSTPPGTVDINRLILFVLMTSSLSKQIATFLNSLSSLESNFISVERCKMFQELDIEQNYTTFPKDEKRFKLPKSKKQIKAVVQPPKAKFFKQGKVELIDLTAQYPTKPLPVLSNITITVNPGEKVGIVGRTGAGKTSFIKLFWRYLNAKSGKVVIDGHNIAEMDLKSLRNEVMIVSQRPALFAGTLRENILPQLQYLYQKKSKIFLKKEKEIIDHLVDLGFSQIKLSKHKYGLDYEVDIDGTNLSKGERQIVSFVRSLVDIKKIIVLDEATASIDLKSEQMIQKKIDEFFKESTMFVIAHRIQTVLGCDKILVLEHGSVKEFDSPQELLKNPESEFSMIYEMLKKSNLRMEKKKRSKFGK